MQKEVNMHRNILNDDQIMNVEFQIDRTEMTHFHQSIEILYVLEGNPIITIQNNAYQAKPEDVLVVNANKKHSYQSEDDVLLGRFEINFRQLGDILETNQILFWCNSVMNKNAAYNDMRRIMKQIFSQYFEQVGQGKIILQGLYYQLLQVLVENFIVQSGDKRFESKKSQDEDRIAEIVNYIHSNYKRKINLNELGDYLYLSVPYLSKYIKKQLGMNFMDYLRNIRLFHAVDDLLYTSQSITTIAMDNGFANTAAFSEAFKQTYNMTPTEYRQQMNSIDLSKNKQIYEEQQKLVVKRITGYLDNKLVMKPKDVLPQDEYVLLDVNHRELYKPFWKKMINAGRAGDLLRFDMQEHVLMLKHELGFEYVRIWDVFAQEMLLNENNCEGKYHFERLDKVLDFLVENGIKPYLELGYKPKSLHSTLKNQILLENRDIPFESKKGFERFFAAFSAHIVNRYGLEEIETWYFEQWSGEDFEHDPNNSTFFEVFDTVYKIMKRHSDSIRIGGGGIGIQYGSGNLSDLVQTWSQRKSKPDFITLYCYPYIKGDEDGVAYARQSTDRDFLKNQLEIAEVIIRECGMGDVEIHVSEWSSTISNRNILNDSCYKGAYLIKNIIDSFECTNVLGYWTGSDIFAEHADSDKLLFGGCGLLNIQGIKKPAFYAYRFMDMLGKYLIHKDQNSIVTTNGNNSYSIVTHNYRHLNYKYYLKAEDELELEKLYQFYEDNQTVQLNYQLANVKNGKYKIKTYSVNSEYGSIQEELHKIGDGGSLSKQEEEYMKRICTPHIQIRQCQVLKNVLNFETRMKVQEIQYIHISYLYE